MTTKPALTDPELSPYLPLVYLAWADGDLTAAEISTIQRRVRRIDELPDDARSSLCAWLDPDAPPSSTDVYGLLSTIRRRAEDLSCDERAGLTELVDRLASGSSEAGARALEELEGALGIGRGDTSSRLLGVGRPRPESSADAVEPRPFDVDALARYLDGSHRAQREEVRRLLASDDFGHRDLDRAAYRDRVLEWTRRLAERGHGALAYPEAAGGAADLGAFVAVFETLAHHDLSLLVKFGVQFGLFGGSVQNLGTERHLDTLRKAGTAELLGCFAMTEIGHGSNVREIETTATYDPSAREFELHSPSESAGKNWAGNAARHATMATVFAQLHVGGEHHGVHAFLVPIRDDRGQPRSGVRIADNGPKMGLEGVDNGRIWFDRVRVPKDALLDRFASVSDDAEYESPIPSDTKRFFTMVGTLVGGRISVGAASVSVAKSALAIAVKYAIRRRQFGEPGEPEMKIMDYQTHQTRLMPQLARTYALHFAMRDLVDRYRAAKAEGEDSQQVEARAAGLKAYATWHGRDTLQVCRECCGGEGYALVNRIGAFMNDFEVFTTFEGDNTVLVQLLTRSLLSGYKRQFTNMDLFGMVRFAAGWAQKKVEGINPMSGRSTDSETLRSRDHHLHVLGVREEQLLSSVAARLKKRLDAGLEGVDALNQVQDHVVSTGLAHVERVTYEAMCSGVDACEDEGLRGRLDRLRALYGVHCLMEHRAWFLENGYFQGPQSRAIRDEFLALCAEVREEAAALVEAFAIPDAVLAAPIAVSAEGHS